MSYQLLLGDCLEVMRTMPDATVQTCVTSPPYFGLRDYQTATWEGGDADCDHRKVQDAAKAIATSTLEGGKKTTGHLQEGYGMVCPRCGARRIDAQIGLESSPDEYVAKLVDVFREVRRVLHPTGTCWINLGDSMLPNKCEAMIPHRTAMALMEDGWICRSTIIWHKPNPMPESVTDRPTKSHEYIFLLSKSASYYYDSEAIKESAGEQSIERYQREKAKGMTNDNGHKYDFKPTVGIGIRSQQGACDYILSAPQ